MSPVTQIVSALLVACFLVSPLDGGNPRLLSVERIWDRADHSAFTDLIRHRGVWFCVFREGKQHGHGDTGRIRILRSRDAQTWESAALLEKDGVDLRDPKLSTRPDGQLMLLAGGSVYDGEGFLTRRPQVSFSPDGRNWSALQPVLAEEHWLWRATWFQGTAYSVSKMGDGKDTRQVILYSSKDGIHWDWVTVFRKIPAWPNETTLRFMPDGEMVALLRRNKTGWIGTSRPPYKDWTWHETGHRLGGPNFIRLPNGELWAGSRNYGDEYRTVLARMTQTTYEPVLTLPSGGDTSYPGMVWHQGLLWMSYYSSHEGKSSIYLARIQFEP